MKVSATSNHPIAHAACLSVGRSETALAVLSIVCEAAHAILHSHGLVQQSEVCKSASGLVCCVCALRAANGVAAFDSGWIRTRLICMIKKCRRCRSTVCVGRTQAQARVWSVRCDISAHPADTHAQLRFRVAQKPERLFLTGISPAHYGCLSLSRLCQYQRIVSGPQHAAVTLPCRLQLHPLRVASQVHPRPAKAQAD